jgi:hypothetical protein
MPLELKKIATMNVFRLLPTYLRAVDKGAILNCTRCTILQASLLMAPLRWEGMETSAAL